MDIQKLCEGELFKDETSHIVIYSSGGIETTLEKDDQLKDWDGFLLIFKKDGSNEILLRYDDIVKIDIVNSQSLHETIQIF